jgi:hypothetical protein
MVRLNRAQRVALKRVYDRAEIRNPDGSKETYRQFRKTVQGGFDCVMVYWFGMWLGIEQDGYTHS